MAEVFWKSWTNGEAEKSIKELFDEILLKNESPFPDHVIVPEFNDSDNVLITTYVPSFYTKKENDSLMKLISKVIELIPVKCHKKILLSSGNEELSLIWKNNFTICQLLNEDGFVKIEKQKIEFSPFSSSRLKYYMLSDWYLPLSIVSANQIIPIVPFTISPIFQVNGVISSFFWFLPTKSKNEILIQKTSEKRIDAYMEILSQFLNKITLSGGLYQNYKSFSVFGNDPASVDAFSSASMGIRASNVLTTKYCRKNKIGVADLLKIHVQGERFKKPILNEQLTKQGSFKFYFDPINCTFCRKCIHVCPSQSIFIQDKKLFYVQKQCNLCGLCISICPEKAIKIL